MNHISCYELCDDEIILMIRKNNEEALGLLFSIYETKMSFEAFEFEKKYNQKYFDANDFYQEILINFMDVIYRYDMNEGRFYSFWLVVMRRYINGLALRTFNKEDMIRFPMSFEEIQDTYENIEDTKLNKFSSTDYDDFFNILEKKKGKNSNYSLCLSLWCQGFKYKEICKITGFSQSKVNYYIRESINILKALMTQKNQKNKS